MASRSSFILSHSCLCIVDLHVLVFHFEIRLSSMLMSIIPCQSSQSVFLLIYDIDPASHNQRLYLTSKYPHSLSSSQIDATLFRLYILCIDCCYYRDHQLFDWTHIISVATSSKTGSYIDDIQELALVCQIQLAVLFQILQLGTAQSRSYSRLLLGCCISCCQIAAAIECLM